LKIKNIKNNKKVVAADCLVVNLEKADSTILVLEKQNFFCFKSAQSNFKKGT